MRCIRFRLRDESGMALVFALGMMSVLAISSMAAITYTSSNARATHTDNAVVSARALA